MCANSGRERLPAQRDPEVSSSTESREAVEDEGAGYSDVQAGTLADHRDLQARKALTAVLIQQGLRPTREGGHEAALQAA